MKPFLIIDARCLQHPDFARRGIGTHLTTMLAAPQAAAYAITLLFDPDLPAPDPAHAGLGDYATTTAYAASRTPGLFLQPAPSSFPPDRIARLIRAPLIRTIAVIHDFIPADFPTLYLTTATSRRAYAACLAALRRYDQFLPNSCATEQRLHSLIPSSIGRTSVTGIAIRASLTNTELQPTFAARTGILVVAGDDPRKNPDIVLRANLDATIQFVGIHDPATRARLHALHSENNHPPETLIFLPPVTDPELATLYARARLVVAPSRAEGFSLPIIEAMAQATPVLAADEPAQAELLGPTDRFGPDDVAQLHQRATQLLTNPLTWRAAQRRQAGVWPAFTEPAVAARFWRPIQAIAAQPAPAILRNPRPKIAFLSPLPPTPSGCADHSAALLSAMATTADVTVFTDSIDPKIPPHIALGGPATGAVMRSHRYDAIIAILGNSPFHRTETRLLLDYGAAAILHDSRLSGFYRGTFGLERALGVASGELGRDVTQAELDSWEHDELTMPARFLGEIAAASTPLIVHAAETTRYLADSYGKTARFLPFAPYRLPDPASLTIEGRAAARQRLGIPDGAILVASFGDIHVGKEPERLIGVFAVLAGTRVCRFALLGSGNPALTASLRAQAEAAGIAAADLKLDSERISEAVYRDHLAAADIAIQLRRAPPGSISGALTDVIAAGMPCVAAATLVEALRPPSYVKAVADDAEPAVIAASVIALLDAGFAGIPALREQFLRDRSMAGYATALIDAVMR